MGGGGAHGVVVFDARGGGDIGDGSGDGERLEFVATGGGGVLDDHKSTVKAGMG